ncbi:MAG: PAS domain-containing protein [Melioribacteraceae bacterium]|nr:PAS domain-containing protein [Melioribacteraceae bacterium]
MMKKDLLHFNLSGNPGSKNYLGINSPGNPVLFDNKIWIVVHEGGRVLYANDKCKRVLNILEEDNLTKLKTEPDLGSLLDNLNNYNYTNFTFEIFVDINGYSSTYQVDLERVYIEGEKYFVLIFNSQADNSRLESRISTLHNALEHGQIPVIITNEKGRIVYATRSFENLLGLELDVIYNNHLSSVFSWYLDNRDIAEIQAAVIQRKKWSTNIFIKGKADETLVYDLVLNPVKEEGDSLYSFILTAHDVSYYHQKNLIIKKSEAKLRSIINNISDLLLIFRKADDGFIIEGANNGFKQEFGPNLDNTNSTITKKIIDPEFSGKLINSCELMHRNKLEVFDFDYVKDDETYYAAKLSYHHDPNHNDYLYILVLRDITESIKQEKQIKEAYKREHQLNKLKTTFMQNMSHELRTPATAIHGYNEIIADCLASNDYEAIQELSRSLGNVVSRLINLFTKILEISEIESNEVEMNIVRQNCNKILSSVYEKSLQNAEKKKIELTLKLSESHNLIEIDWYKFEKVITYLVDNSIKYTDYGKVVIASRKEGDRIIVSVSDTGIGMHQTTVNWLLESFVQEDEDGLTREYEGTGLGLTIAYKYTKLMGGDMKITSEKNVGTVIDISFPIVQKPLGW